MFFILGFVITDASRTTGPYLVMKVAGAQFNITFSGYMSILNFGHLQVEFMLTSTMLRGHTNVVCRKKEEGEREREREGEGIFCGYMSILNSNVYVEIIIIIIIITMKRKFY